MAKSVKVNSTLKDAGKGHSVWKEDLNFVVGETKFDDFVALFNAAEGLNKDCAEKDAQLAGLKNTRDEKTRQLQGIVTSLASAVSHVVTTVLVRLSTNRPAVRR